MLQRDRKLTVNFNAQSSRWNDFSHRMDGAIAGAAAGAVVGSAMGGLGKTIVLAVSGAIFGFATAGRKAPAPGV